MPKRRNECLEIPLVVFVKFEIETDFVWVGFLPWAPLNQLRFIRRRLEIAKIFLHQPLPMARTVQIRWFGFFFVSIFAKSAAWISRIEVCRRR